jgi:prophage regulatory protein
MTSPEVFLSDFDLAARYGVHRSTPWRWAKSVPDFPKPTALSPGCTRWKLSQIEAWENSRAKSV